MPFWVDYLSQTLWTYSVGVLVCLSRADLKHIDASAATIMMAPCKNMKYLAGKSCPLILGAGGKYIDPVMEINNMLRVDPTPHGEEKGAVAVVGGGGGEGGW